MIHLKAALTHVCFFVSIVVFANEPVNEVHSFCPETQLMEVQATFSPCSEIASSLTCVVSSITPITTYSIDGGLTTQLSPTFSNVPSGNYFLSVTNTLNCTVVFPFTVSNPDLPVFSFIEVKDVSCQGNNGVIEFEVNLGAAPYIYSMEFNGFGIYPLASDSIAGFQPGTYQIIVEDNNGCQIDSIVTILDYDFPIIDQVILNNPTCNVNDGSIEIILANPPIGNYITSYLIGDGLSYQSQSANTFNNLGSGQYFVYALVDGCLSGMGFPMIVNLIDDNPFIQLTSLVSIAADCGDSNGSIGVSATNTNGALFYSINGGLTYGSSNLFENLSEGTYTISLLDTISGCELDTTLFLEDLSGPFINNVVLSQPDCGVSNGQITVAATIAGGLPLVYSIDLGVSSQPDGLFSNLSSGMYTITVENNFGCTADTTLFLEDLSGPLINNVVLSQPDCGVSNGQITVAASIAGGLPLVYSIDLGASSQPDGLFSNLSSGMYTITVENNFGCTADSTLFLEDLSGPLINNVVLSQPDCGVSNGQITVAASISGGLPLVYSIDLGASSQPDGLFSNLSSGTYTITVENNFGCVTDTIITLLDNAIPFVNGGSDQQVCSGNSVVLNGTGSPSSLLSWNNGVLNNVSFIPIESGVYEVTAISQNGCSSTDQVIITLIEPIIPEIYINLNQDCLPVNASIGIVDDGFTNCMWDISNGYVGNSCGEQNVLFSSSGCFDIDLITTDVNGCIVNSSINDAICFDPGPEANFSFNASNITTEESFVQLINTSENSSTYQWQLLNGEVSTEENPIAVSPSIPGVYPILLIASNELGCSDSIIKFITIEELVSCFIPNSFTPNGDGINQIFLPVLTDGFNLNDYSFLIFNRWGQLVFESRDPAFGWDGTFDGRIVPDGVYTYQIRTTLIKNAGVLSYVGHIAVIK